MPKQRPAFLQRLSKTKRQQFPWRAGLVGLAVAIIGTILIFRSFAADGNSAADLNGDGKINITDLSMLLSKWGTAGPQGDIDGSGAVNITDLSILLSNFGKTVSQPADPFVPANVKALTGGNSVGLRWDSSTPPAGQTIKEYNIFRNGTKIGTVVPLPSPAPTPKPLVECFELKGNCYIDKSITKGTTYNYQVQAVTVSGQESSLSASVSVTPPTTGVPEPTINVNLNGHTEFQQVINGALPTIKYLYPKIADYLSRGEYAVPSTLTINVIAVTDPDTTSYYASGSTGTITINASYLADKSPAAVATALLNAAQDIAFLHERSQVVEWSYQGIRDYLKDFYYHSRDPVVPQGTGTYTYNAQNAGHLSSFFDWIQRHHEPNYVHRLATLYAKKNFNDSYAHFASGKDIDQLWAEMHGKPDHTGNLINAATGKCVTNNSDVSGDTGRLWLSGCTNANSQKFTLENNDVGYLELHMSGRCIGHSRTAEADGTYSTALRSCLISLMPLWRYDKTTRTLSDYIDGVKVCLATRSHEDTGEGPLLELVVETCEPGKASQTWEVPANSPHNLEVPVRLKNDPTKCLKNAKPSTDSGIPFHVEECIDGNVANQRTILDFTSDGSLRIRGFSCLQPENSGAANGTRAITGSCADNKNVMWRYEDNKFVNVGTGKCLDVGSIAVGQSTATNNCTGSPSQLFTFP